MSSMSPEIWAELRKDPNYTAIVGEFHDTETASSNPGNKSRSKLASNHDAIELMQDRAEKERLKRLVALTKMQVWTDIIGIIKGNLDAIERTMRTPKLSRDELGDLALQKLAIQNLLDSFLEVVLAAQDS